MRELIELARQFDAAVERVAATEGPRLRAQMARSRDAIKKPILREVSNIRADSRGLLRRLFLLIPAGDDSPDTEPPSDTPPPTPSDQTAPFSRSEMSLVCSYTTSFAAHDPIP